MTLHDLFLVASGIIPEVVIDNDVDAEIDNEEAFIRKLYSNPFHKLLTYSRIIYSFQDMHDPLLHS